MKMSWQSRRKTLILATAVLVMFSLGAASAKAIGLTPGRTTIDFEPNLEKSITFTIINNEHKDFKAFVYAEGDLKDYITAEKNIIEFKETDESKPFTYRFRLPEKLETPGDNWAKLVVMELPEAGNEAGQIVMATTAVAHQLRVKVPYPGKYAELDLAINEVEPNTTATFFVKVFNLGTENIYKAFATVDILGPTNDKIASVESETIAIESKKSGEITIPWEANVNPGTYRAVVSVNYDGKTAKIEKNFVVGAMRIEVLDVKVRNFVLGGIAKFEINIENKWNQRIDNVFGEMVISSQKGDQVASFKSASVDVEPLQRATLYAYWDTEGVEKGTYDAKLILHYAGKTSEKLLKTQVELESIETEIVGMTARAITTKGGAGPGADILVPLVLILVMINAGWFFYFRRRKKQ
jgi:methionine-rich copper-binding protein CopC